MCVRGRNEEKVLNPKITFAEILKRENNLAISQQNTRPNSVG